jgi:hypothetical protein
MDEAGGDVFVHRLLRDIAVALGLDRAFAQLRRQGAGAGNELVGARNSACRRSRPQFGDAHDVSSDWQKTAPGATADQAARQAAGAPRRAMHIPSQDANTGYRVRETPAAAGAAED